MAYKILKDFRGSPDGMAVIDYNKGEVVDLVPSLAQIALEEKWAKEVSDPVTADPQPEPATNDVTGQPELSAPVA